MRTILVVAALFAASILVVPTVSQAAPLASAALMR